MHDTCLFILLDFTMSFYGDSNQKFTMALLQHADDHTCDDGEPMYLPAVVFSSELTSKSSHPLYPKRLRVLSYEDMDDLNQKLTKLYHDNISSHGSMEEELRCGDVDDRETGIQDDDVDLGIVHEEVDEDEDKGNADDTANESLNDQEPNRRKEPPLGRMYYCDVATDSDSMKDVDKEEVTRLKKERFLGCIFENDVETDSDSLEDHNEDEGEANRLKEPMLGRIYKRIVHRKSKSDPSAICFNVGMNTLPTAGRHWIEDGDGGDGNRKNEPVLGRLSKRIFHRKSESAPVAGYSKADTAPTSRKVVRSPLFSARLAYPTLSVRGT
jgi:hypothetical protein